MKAFFTAIADALQGMITKDNLTFVTWVAAILAMVLILYANDRLKLLGSCPDEVLKACPAPESESSSDAESTDGAGAGQGSTTGDNAPSTIDLSGVLDGDNLGICCFVAGERQWIGMIALTALVVIFVRISGKAWEQIRVGLVGSDDDPPAASNPSPDT